jgi:hypothetical protein
MKNDVIVKLHSSFESSVNQSEGIEFWFARDLQILLGSGAKREVEDIMLNFRVMRFQKIAQCFISNLKTKQLHYDRYIRFTAD